MTRIRVGVLFGGRSGEHDVSLASAASVLRALDPEKYEAVPIGITREGQWLHVDSPAALLAAEENRRFPADSEAMPDMTHHAIVRAASLDGAAHHVSTVDVVFPVLHGPNGEDGTIQGVFEVAGIPYVGSGVLGSALSMDKAMMKAVFEHAGLPGVSYQLVNQAQWVRDRATIVEYLEAEMTYPVFVKPCNMGSSVGIYKAHDRKSLANAIDGALRFDRRVIVEQGIDAREVECAVLGNDDPEVSVPGEIVFDDEFYDYESKYTPGKAELRIPAPLSPEQVSTVRKLARQAFLAVDAAGLARVDFFIRRSDGAVLVNEINTMPGFTSTSMYPKLWEASGVSYREIIGQLVELALQRHADTQRRSVVR